MGGEWHTHQLEHGGCILDAWVAIRVAEEGEAAVGFRDGFGSGGGGNFEDLVVVCRGCGGCHWEGRRLANWMGLIRK